MVRGPSPSVEKLSRGLPNVHSLPMWNFLYGAKIGGSGTLDYPLRAEKKFEFFFLLMHQWTKSHMERMYDWEPPKEPPCQRGWSYHQQTQSFYWNKAFPLHGKKTKAMNGFSFFLFLDRYLEKTAAGSLSPRFLTHFEAENCEKKEKGKGKKKGGRG